MNNSFFLYAITMRLTPSIITYQVLLIYELNVIQQRHRCVIRYFQAIFWGKIGRWVRMQQAKVKQNSDSPSSVIFRWATTYQALESVDSIIFYSAC